MVLKLIRMNEIEEKKEDVNSRLPTFNHIIYIKKVPFCRISVESALIRNFLRDGRVRG